MTASTVKSTYITNLVASPQTVLPRTAKGRVHSVIDHASVATTSIDEVGDVVLLCPVPSNARIRRMILRNEDLDSNGTPTLAVDVGVYYTGIGHSDSTKTLGTVIDADAFASAITTLQSANLAGTDVRVEATGAIDECLMEVWEAAGLSADCGGYVAIGLTVTTQAATAAAGRVVLEVDYVV